MSFAWAASFTKVWMLPAGPANPHISILDLLNLQTLLVATYLQIYQLLDLAILANKVYTTIRTACLTVLRFDGFPISIEFEFRPGIPPLGISSFGHFKVAIGRQR